jgi:hypothetical protein
MAKNKGRSKKKNKKKGDGGKEETNNKIHKVRMVD